MAKCKKQRIKSLCDNIIDNELGTGRYAEGGGRTTPWKYIGSDGEWHLTSGITAVHFLRNAIQDHIGEYEQIIADELTKRMS